MRVWAGGHWCAEAMRPAAAGGSLQQVECTASGVEAELLCFARLARTAGTSGSAGASLTLTPREAATAARTDGSDPEPEAAAAAAAGGAEAVAPAAAAPSSGGAPVVVAREAGGEAPLEDMPSAEDAYRIRWAGNAAVARLLGAWAPAEGHASPWALPMPGCRACRPGDIARHVWQSISRIKAHSLFITLLLMFAAVWRRCWTWQWPLRSWYRQTAGASRQKWRSASRPLRECAALLLGVLAAAVLHRGAVGTHTESKGGTSQKPEQGMVTEQKNTCKIQVYTQKRDVQCIRKEGMREGRQVAWLALTDSRPVSGWLHQTHCQLAPAAEPDAAIAELPHQLPHHSSFDSSPTGARRPSWEAPAFVGELTLLHTTSQANSSGQQ